MGDNSLPYLGMTGALAGGVAGLALMRAAKEAQREAWAQLSVFLDAYKKSVVAQGAGNSTRIHGSGTTSITRDLNRLHRRSISLSITGGLLLIASVALFYASCNSLMKQEGQNESGWIKGTRTLFA